MIDDTFLDSTYFLLAPPRNRVVENDEDAIQLRCVATSDPSTPVTITWYKGETPINDITSNHGDQYLVTNDGSLFIDFSDLSLDEKQQLEGDYVCLASNGYSSVQATTSLEVSGTSTSSVDNIDLQEICQIVESFSSICNRLN